MEKKVTETSRTDGFGARMKTGPMSRAESTNLKRLPANRILPFYCFKSDEQEVTINTDRNRQTTSASDVILTQCFLFYFVSSSLPVCHTVIGFTCSCYLSSTVFDLHQLHLCCPAWFRCHGHHRLFV